ncbi:ATP-binding protein [Tahibacter amnicola]|uniref:ATP-binding protein n=1 Tax=Tahibacter amnicola TaxID=2976241 RepID=A0ABY6B8I9_9GAMM|nr:ATP-binding protein [Tahibacter amnicola]UXI65821.1 ATP-binding protein [Tahibacter amnicola]
MTASLQKTQVDLAGLMRVLGEALYSTPFVAIRELVQNGHDSCTRRAKESTEPFEPKIQVRTRPGELIIEDNGAGLTLEEIHTYLATVGRGYTRTLREKGGGDDLIGYFGLGFLSAFAISHRVEFWTCSFQAPGLAHRFVSVSGESYSVVVAANRAVGTQVRLFLKDEMPMLGDPAIVETWLRKYCCLLKHPVALNGGVAVNAEPPPWRRQSELSDLRYKTLSLAFARHFENVFDPIATIPVNRADYAVQGMLWIQDGGSFASSDNRNLSVFVRGMLIGEDERNLLPRWAGFVGGVIESTLLQPTASRESLRNDDAYEFIAGVLQQALVSGLRQIAESDPASWRRILSRHNESLLAAALVDATLFKLVGDDVTVRTTEGDFTMPALLERCNGTVYLSYEERAGVESMLLKALKQPIVLGCRFAAGPFCARYAQAHGAPIVVLGTDTGAETLFRPSDLARDEIAVLEACFFAADRDVLVRQFDPPFLPFAVLTNPEAEIRRRLESDEADRRIGQAVLGLARQFTAGIAQQKLAKVYVNAANPVIRELLQLSNERRTQAVAALQPLLSLCADARGTPDMERALTDFGNALLTLLRDGP